MDPPLLLLLLCRRSPSSPPLSSSSSSSPGPPLSLSSFSLSLIHSPRTSVDALPPVAVSLNAFPAYTYRVHRERGFFRLADVL